MMGQDAAAEIRVPDSWIGRYQCILDQDGSLVRVLDLGSRTGTFVNGVRVARADVLPGDLLTVGRTTFLIEYSANACCAPHAAVAQ